MRTSLLSLIWWVVASPLVTLTPPIHRRLSLFWVRAVELATTSVRAMAAVTEEARVTTAVIALARAMTLTTKSARAAVAAVTTTAALMVVR